MFQIEIEGFDELNERFGNPELIKEPLQSLLESAAATGETEMKEAISGGTEMAVRSIGAKVEPLSARVYSAIANKQRGWNIEEGRQPGDAPTILAVAKWISGRPYMTSRRLSELTKAERSEVIRMQEEIRAHGARGKRYLEAASNAIKNSLPGLVDSMARKVEQLWEASRR